MVSNITLPRLFVAQDSLASGADVALTAGQTHYLKNVMRKGSGGALRIFNGHDGEWLAEITALSKKDGALRLREQIKVQPPAPPGRHLFFSPLKKQRQDWLIEKATELGVTNLHPVIMNHSAVRAVNAQRTQKQIMEAAEQCECMTLPTLHDLIDLPRALSQLPENLSIFAALERADYPLLPEHYTGGPAGFIIGPEGGFSGPEQDLLRNHPQIQGMSLGDHILRAETAAIACLSLAHLSNPDST